MSSYALGSGPITCKGCEQPLSHISAKCPSCNKVIDITTLLMVVTEKVDMGEERQTIIAQLRNVFAGGPSVTPGARAHFGKSGPSGKVAALLAIQASGDSSEFPATIMEMSYERAERDLKKEIIRTLGMAGSEESVRVLQRIIEEEQDEEVLVAFGEKLDDSEVDEITFPSLEVMDSAKAPPPPVKGLAAHKEQARLPLGPVQEKDARDAEALIDRRVPSHNPLGPERPVSNPPPSLLGSVPPQSVKKASEPLEDIFGVDEDNEILSSRKPEPKQPPKAPPPSADKPKPAGTVPVGRIAQPQPQVPIPSAQHPAPSPIQPQQPPPQPVPPQPEALPVSKGDPPPARSGRSIVMLVVGALLGGLLGAAATIGVLFAMGALRTGDDPALVAGTPQPPKADPPVAKAEPVTPEKATPSQETAPEATEEVEEVEAAGAPAGESVKLTYTVEATSQHNKFPASNLGDGDTTTVWQEKKREFAIGHRLTFEFEKPVTVVKIGVVVGYDMTHPKKGDFFVQNNRLKSATVTFPDGSTQSLGFDDDRKMQWLPIESPAPLEQLTLKITGAYRGEIYNDNAISEVEFWGY